MEICERKVAVINLKLGMYVSRLEIPWEDTNFPLQGVMVNEADDIEKLAEYSRYVYVDDKRSVSPGTQLPRKRKAEQNPRTVMRAAAKKSAANANVPIGEARFWEHAVDYREAGWFKRHCVEHYDIRSTAKQELSSADPLYQSLDHQVSQLFERITHKRRFEIEPVAEACADLVESVIRNPDALAWMCRIRESKHAVYQHVMRLAIWGCIVGRQLGLNRFSLTHLTMSLLMTGIGKSMLRDDVLLTGIPGQCSEPYQKHLSETLYYLGQRHFSCEDIAGTIENYCERHDGSGYPNQKTGQSIPFLARVAGLIETFDLLINPYDSLKAITAANAIARLNKEKDSWFESSLVEAFVQAVGIYPTGTLVELNNGLVGVVFSQNYERRLQASVIPVLDARGRRFKEFKIFDLNCGKNTQKTDRVFVKRGVPSYEVGYQVLEEIHAHMFCPKRGWFDRLFH